MENEGVYHVGGDDGDLFMQIFERLVFEVNHVLGPFLNGVFVGYRGSSGATVGADVTGLGRVGARNG